MAKNINHVSHIKSKQVVDGKPKLPEASSLIEGEIAINFAEGVETISTKNESGNVVTFSSDEYYTSKKLGSGFTGENSGKTVTEALNSKANTATTLAGYGITDAYTKSETSGKTEIQNALNEKVNTADIVTAITSSNSGSTNPIATSVIAESELVISSALNDLDERKLDATAYTPTDLSNYYKKSETSGKTEIQNALDAKTDTATTTALNNVVTAHTGNTDVHVTTSDKETWNTAASGVTDLSGQSETIAAALVDLNAKLTTALANANTALANANAALAALGGVTIQKITQAEYDALTTKDPNTLYVITD